MLRLFYISCLCSLLLTFAATATAQDVQRFAERDLMGTARYVGMGGAMTAIGGDPTAAMDNPAGLGLYRRNEVTLTIDETIDHSTQISTALPSSAQGHTRSRFAAPNVAVIWSWGNPDKQRGVLYSNIMLSANRLTNYHRDISASANDLSMAQTICQLTNGLSEQNLQNTPWDDVEVGWLSILGYEAYLIDPVDDYQWQPALDFTQGTLTISETGQSNQYTFSWALNVNHQWYLGMGLNLPTLSYTKQTSHTESDRINSAQLKSLYHLSGVGVNGNFGLIYRPIQALRLGLSFQTPTMMSLSVQTEGDLYTTVAGESYSILTPESGVISTKMASPLRTSVSIATQMGSEGLLAVQYDYAHATKDKELGVSPMEDVHTLRIGGEAQIVRGLFFNAGYVYESSFLKEDPVWMLGYNEVRTDMDYRYTQNTQYYSLGLGYRGPALVAQMAYQCRWQQLHQYASEMQMIPMDIQTITHRIVATLAWRF